MIIINNRNIINIINIIRKTLGLVDERLINHGDRVACIVYKMLNFENKHSQEEITDICTLGILYDIGAYKTEEIDHMVEFETKNVWNYSQ